MEVFKINETLVLWALDFFDNYSRFKNFTNTEISIKKYPKNLIIRSYFANIWQDS